MQIYEFFSLIAIILTKKSVKCSRSATLMECGRGYSMVRVKVAMPGQAATSEEAPLLLK